MGIFTACILKGMTVDKSRVWMSVWALRLDPGRCVDECVDPKAEPDPGVWALRLDLTQVCGF